MIIRSHTGGARSGFTIIETIIGIALFGISFISLYAAMAQSLTSIHLSRENVRATQVILEKFEVIRLYNWQRLNDPLYLPRTFEVTYTPPGSGGLPSPNTRPGTTYHGTITITEPPFSANYSSNMKLVTVEVTWMTGKLQRNRSLSTFVAFDGLHSYVY
jgi:Tfp pilus assembly protein PilV